LSGLDIALWDLRGKQQDRPVYELLGGAVRRFPAYASLFRLGEPELAAEAASAARSQGFVAAKLHDSRAEVVAAARAACGASFPLAADFSCACLECAEALERIRPLEEFDPLWIEEPVWPPDDESGLLGAVRRRVHVPLAAGESELNPLSLARLAASGAVDVIQPSVTKIGGISGVLEFFRAADVSAVKVVPHSFYLGPGLLATLHLAALLPDDTMIEWMTAEPEARILGDTLRPEAGLLALPAGAGLGLDPDPDVVAAYRTTGSAP
jgi:L-alanine-DL-glutamate epimerase-like enolase superfamily enzyme